MGEIFSMYWQTRNEFYGTDHLGNLVVDGKKMLQWILKKQIVRVYGLDSSGSEWGPVVRSCEQG